MAQYITPNNVRWFIGGATAGAKYYDELSSRINAAKTAGSILRQRYNRYYYTGSVKQKYFKPSGASNSTVTRSFKKRYRSKMPMRRSYKRRPMMRRRRFTRRRVSRKTRWQAKARRMVGNPKNYSTSKTTESVLPSVITNLATNTLSARQLILISGTSTNSINARQRDTCNIAGIKLNATFKNELETRVYVNWAVVHGKQGQEISPGTPDFFRGYQNERAIDANAGTQTGLSYSVNQINTDEFVVLKRGKFMLTPGVVPSTVQGQYNYGGNTKEISCWCKLGRQFYFDDGSAAPQDQVYFVCWVADPSAGPTPVSLQMTYRLRAICYWREPRGG